VRERLPEDGVTYQAAADPSGGRRDAFTVAIGHQVGNRIVVDVVRDWLFAGADQVESLLIDKDGTVSPDATTNRHGLRIRLGGSRGALGFHPSGTDPLVAHSSRHYTSTDFGGACSAAM
jgi:hypothetical protein